MTDPIVAIRSAGIIPIVRGLPAGELLRIARVLLEEGIGVLEISLNIPEALSAATALRDAYRDLTVGVGTVVTPEQVVEAAGAGAQFLVSPHVNHRIASAAREAGLPLIPGALTPSEILQAKADGARLIKLFPADALGPSYIRHLSVPLPDLALVPTGGISAKNAADYIAAGAAAVGVGGSLFGPATRDTARLRSELQALRAAVAQGRRQRA